MKSKLSLLTAGIYAAFLLVGPHGPFALDHHADDHPHTHKKHVIKLLRTEGREGKRLLGRKYIAITS